MKGLLLFAASCWMATLVAGLSLQEFDQIITLPCLSESRNFLNGRDNNPRHLANSLEGFVGLVEVIERKNPTWNIYDVTKSIIKRFAFDGILLDSDGSAKQDSHYANRVDIIDRLVDLHNDVKTFNEDDLSAEQKCQMFFMLGHMVNNTIRDGLDEEILANPPSHGVHADVIDQTKHRSAKHPREQGVVSLFGDEHHAIALGKVLIGIAAAQNPQITEVGSMFDWKQNQNQKNYPFLSDKIENVVGVTIADVLAHSVITGSKDSPRFGTGGNWNTSYCTVEYQLHESNPGSTMASIRGAIDGLLIATALKDMQNTNGRDLSLSKVLRMYYDPRGIPRETGQSFTYCRRSEFNSLVSNNEQQLKTLEAYYHCYFVLHNNNNKYDNNIGTKVSDALSALRNSGSLFSVNDGRCLKPMIENKCETISNVFVILDDSDRGTTGFDYQQQTIGRLASNLDIGVGAGSMSIFFNARSGGANLYQVVYNATNQAVATCAISRRDQQNIPESVDEESLMRALNSTLQDWELKTAEEAYAHSKAVVLFKFSELKMNDEKRVNNAANIVRNGHRDTRVIGVGENQRVLQTLTTYSQDAIVGMMNNYIALGDKLYDKICEIPSIFQVDNCWNRRTRNTENHKHSGFVTPFYTQYWAMYPEYFHKSSVVEYKFVADGSNGEVMVCFSRTHTNPKENEKSTECQTTKAEDRELVFYMKDPCHTYSVNNCPPAYFSVTGKEPQKGIRGVRCQNEKCRRTDQIQFTFSHTGVFCSGCLMLKASPLALIVVLATLYSVLFKH